MRIVLIGCGYWGKILLSKLITFADAETKASIISEPSNPLPPITKAFLFFNENLFK